MNITKQQILNPGIYSASDKHRKKIKKYQKSVDRARFLSDKEKKHWKLLAYIMTNAQLEEAERMILNEEIRQLKIKQSLEKIKPKPKRNG